jgi:magnesium-transporting ATPase (P-type)
VDIKVKKNPHVSHYIKTYTVSDRLRKLGAAGKKSKHDNSQYLNVGDYANTSFLHRTEGDEGKDFTSDQLFDITNSRKFNILGINSLNKRGRMSIIVNNPERGKYMFTLYVKGSFESMRRCLKLGKKDLVSYNQIGRLYRNRGLTPIVYAMRLLT